MVIRWTRAPRASRWFTDPDYAGDLADHLTDPRIAQWMVLLDGALLGYLQDYDIHGWEGHPLGFLPKGARGLDTLIGAEDQMGQGLGPRYLAQHCAALFAQGTPALGIDPDPDNLAAIRAYEKVGFLPGARATSRWGEVLTMSLFPHV
jgi:aminoglycoside 6'-N-acetyltransferase